jgi:hypothetical protein
MVAEMNPISAKAITKPDWFGSPCQDSSLDSEKRLMANPIIPPKIKQIIRIKLMLITNPRNK